VSSPAKNTMSFIAADDVRMPGLSGLDIQGALAAARISIPIIFITGHGDIPMAVKALKAGAVEFLAKPVHEQALLDAVRVGLQRDRIRRQRADEERDLRCRFDALSTRERETVALVTEGLMNKQVAAKLGVSEVSIKGCRHDAMQKLGARSLPDLVRIADTLGVRSKKPGRSLIKHEVSWRTTSTPADLPTDRVRTNRSVGTRRDGSLVR
jgi:FixJ family two-component response regulator